MGEPSKAELLRLLAQAGEWVVESHAHWGAVLHLTGHPRTQRRQREVLALLDAMIREVEGLPEREAPVSN